MARQSPPRCHLATLASPRDREFSPPRRPPVRMTQMTTRRSTALRCQLLSSSLGIAVAAISLLASVPAGATQPLETFLESARKSNYDVREQTATVEQRNWER